MKNLFDFATKELSQDAFLRWFIEENLENGGCKLLSEFTGEDANKIKIIKTWAQSEHIDICVDFMVDGKPHILIIEDKVNTDQHSDQLIRYMNVVKKWNDSDDKYNNRPSHFVFYKTRIVKDKDAIEKVNNDGNHWIVFDLEYVAGFFSQYDNSDNLIINQYAEYVEGLLKQSKNTILPEEHQILAWKSFFENTVKPKFDNYDCDIRVGETFYGYSYINFKPKKYEWGEVPYLEFRSRDCLDGYLNGRILLYGVETSAVNIESIKTKIENLKGHFFMENNSKQIASTKKRNQKGIEYKNQDEFIDQIDKLVKEYLDLFK